MSPAALGSRPGGTEAPFAYVIRTLGLLEVHRRGRPCGARLRHDKAAGTYKLDGGRLAPALPSSLTPWGAQRAREAVGAVRSIGADIVLRRATGAARGRRRAPILISPR
jgi:hypothetical protein